MRKEERTRSASPNTTFIHQRRERSEPRGGGQSLLPAPCLDPEFCPARGLTCVQVEMKTPQTPGGSPVLLLLLLLTGVCIDAYKPVIIVHGILDGPREFKTMSLFITKVGAQERTRVLKKNVDLVTIVSAEIRNGTLLLLPKSIKIHVK